MIKGLDAYLTREPDPVEWVGLPSRKIKALRVQRMCYICGQVLPVGAPAIRDAGIQDGQFGQSFRHPVYCYEDPSE